MGPGGPRSSSINYVCDLFGFRSVPSNEVPMLWVQVKQLKLYVCDLFGFRSVPSNEVPVLWVQVDPGQAA